MESRGQKERNRGRGSKARKNPYQSPYENAEETESKVSRLQGDLEARHDAKKEIHAQNPQGPLGSCAFSHTSKTP